jgi:7-keto-8-aminopelargonate synthetase-like enzyme
MAEACAILWRHDILVTPATFPAVPLNRNLVRFSTTSANTEWELDQAIAALREVSNVLRPAVAAKPMAEAFTRLPA